jgi:hypothetical protein
MRTVLGSILWTALSATLLSAILYRGAVVQLPPAALVVTAGYAALALAALTPRRAIRRRRRAALATHTAPALPDRR